MNSEIANISSVDANCLDADQIDHLVQMARETFDETFRQEFESEPFDGFLDAAYGPSGTMRQDLSNPSIHWRIAMNADMPVAFVKLRPLCAPAPAPLAGSMELQQIYVKPQWHGTGVAQCLMNWSIDTAISNGAKELYLTVFDFNERAKAFYARNGFTDVGYCKFQIGNRIENDRIWMRTL